jgi:serine protease Do
MDDFNRFSENGDAFDFISENEPKEATSEESTRENAQEPSGTPEWEFVTKYSEEDVNDFTVEKPKKYVTRKAFVVTLVMAILVSSIIGAGSVFMFSKIWKNSTKAINSTNYTLTSATGSELSMQEIIAKNKNSVVAITTESVSTDSWLGNYVTSGAGSGVVYSADGYILTNNHVIDGATTITVTMDDGTTYQAKLLATDSQTDIAVLKVEATGLTPVTLAKDDSTLSVGDLAVAIGNPLGTLAGTATEGIISALEREITIDGNTMTLLQTSASINPGNSGGGLFDQYGNLIGIVVAKSSGSDIEGLGFAIPASTVGKIAASLIENGYVTGRPAAGVTIVDLTSVQDAMKYGVRVTGVYIQSVTGENAKAAGLQAGDLLYMIDGEKVTSGTAAVSTIRSKSVGDKITFTIVRDNEMQDISFELEESQNENQVNS